MPKINIAQVISLLAREYGSPDGQPNCAPLATLIQTILSQNTSDTNSRRAFESLLTSFSGWEDVAAAEVGQVAAAIRGGGLAEIKAERITRTLQQIQQERGRLTLDFLSELPLAEARDWLKHLPGVGTKTANCVLLFSFGRPALPVDTHIFRVAKRLGLVDAQASIEQAHGVLAGLVPDGSVYQFHVLLIEHGRRVCKAQRPRCLECVLRWVCPSCEKPRKS